MENTSVSFVPAFSGKDPVEDLHDRIVRHAWDLWLSRHKPVGREAEIWLEAECDVLSASFQALAPSSAEDAAELPLRVAS